MEKEFEKQFNILNENISGLKNNVKELSEKVGIQNGRLGKLEGYKQEVLDDKIKKYDEDILNLKKNWWHSSGLVKGVWITAGVLISVVSLLFPFYLNYKVDKAIDIKAELIQSKIGEEVRRHDELFKEEMKIEMRKAFDDFFLDYELEIEIEGGDYPFYDVIDLRD
jgi:hypothetical protein